MKSDVSQAKEKKSASIFTMKSNTKGHLSTYCLACKKKIYIKRYSLAGIGVSILDKENSTAADKECLNTGDGLHIINEDSTDEMQS
jgi:hypothetical protein